MLIVMGLQVLIKAPITAVWAICKIADKSWQWTFSTAVAFVALLAIVGVCMLLTVPKFKKLQTLTDNLNRIDMDAIAKIGFTLVAFYTASMILSAIQG